MVTPSSLSRGVRRARLPARVHAVTVIIFLQTSLKHMCSSVERLNVL